MLYHNPISDLSNGSIDILIMQCNLECRWHGSMMSMFKGVYPELYARAMNQTHHSDKTMRPKIGSIVYIQGRRLDKNCCLVVGFMGHYDEKIQQDILEEDGIIGTINNIKDNCDKLVGYDFKDIKIGLALHSYYDIDMLEEIESIIQSKYDNIELYLNQKDMSAIGPVV